MAACRNLLLDRVVAVSFCSSLPDPPPRAHSLTDVTKVKVMCGRWLPSDTHSGYHGLMLIRNESGADHAVIAELNRRAFAGNLESELIDNLRAEKLVLASLVAVDAYDRILGHILFSRARLQINTGEIPVASLGPMCVDPEMHRRGIGSALVRHGIRACRRLGESAIIVVGNPTFYAETGFSRHVVSHLQSPYAGETFMGLELIPGSLTQFAGEVVYPCAFAAFA